MIQALGGMLTKRAMVVATPLVVGAALVGCKAAEDGMAPDQIADRRIDRYGRDGNDELDISTEGFRTDKWVQYLCTSYGKNGVCNVSVPIFHENDYNIRALLSAADEFGQVGRAGLKDGKASAAEISNFIKWEFDTEPQDGVISGEEFKRFEQAYGEHRGRE